MYHRNNSGTGSYTVNIKKFINDEVIDINSVKANTVGALWQSNVIFGDPLEQWGDFWKYKDSNLPQIYKDTNGAFAEYACRELYIWDVETMKQMYIVLDDLIPKLESQSNTILIIEGVALAAVGGLTGFITVPAGTTAVAIGTAAGITTWSASYFLLDDLLTGSINDVINKAKDLKAQLDLFFPKDPNMPVPSAPVLVYREVTYIKKAYSQMPGYYQLYQTYFELKDVTAYNDLEYINSNSNEFGGTITLYDNNENSIQKVSEVFKSMVNRYPSS